MVKNALEEIGGIGMYGVVSICLFFTVFVGALIWTFLHKKSFCVKMSGLPLEDETIKPDFSHE